MKERMFLKEMAEIILTAIECSYNKRLKSEVHLIGRFNYRVFNPYRMFRQCASGYVRMMMILAMGMSREEFRQMMNGLTDRILDAAESEECDLIISEHGRKRKSY